MFEGDAAGMHVWDGSESQARVALKLVVICGGDVGGERRVWVEKVSVICAWFSESMRYVGD